MNDFKKLYSDNYKLSSKEFKVKFPEEYKIIKETPIILKNIKSFRIHFYCMAYNITEPPKCNICHSLVLFRGDKFNDTCSNKCATLWKIKDKIKLDKTYNFGINYKFNIIENSKTLNNISNRPVSLAERVVFASNYKEIPKCKCCYREVSFDDYITYDYKTYCSSTCEKYHKSLINSKENKRDIHKSIKGPNNIIVCDKGNLHKRIINGISVEHEDFEYNKWYNCYCNIIEKAQYSNYDNVYTETHHIIPKSLGGSDCNNNLVLLSGKEHYYLHKLLVRFCKGLSLMKMNKAHYMMASKNKDKPFVTSNEYHRSKEQASLSRRDPSVYHFEHPDYGTKICTRYELAQNYDVTIQGLTDIIKGRQKSHNGWYLNKYTFNRDDQWCYGNCIINMKHISGEIFKGPAKEFKKKYKIKEFLFRNIHRGRSTVFGWSMDANQRSMFWQEIYNNPLEEQQTLPLIKNNTKGYNNEFKW